MILGFTRRCEAHILSSLTGETHILASLSIRSGSVLDADRDGVSLGCQSPAILRLFTDDLTPFRRCVTAARQAFMITVILASRFSIVALTSSSASCCTLSSATRPRSLMMSA
jgi:hypothetical protein